MTPRPSPPSSSSRCRLHRRADPAEGLSERLREICTKHGILLIFDEVITGFGRLGTPFAAEYFDVTPDMMTTAKGLTNGVVPMGAVFARCKSTTPS
jgi:beta-alanine--pyruvate transaminase